MMRPMRHRSALPVTCLLPAMLLAGCANTPPPGPIPPARTVHTLTIDAKERSYILRIPPQYDGRAKLPLVMLLHGANDSAAYAEEAYHFVEKSNAAGFLLVFPDALGDYHAWNGLGHDQDAKADLDFLTMLLESLPKEYLIDPKRVYVCGHSAGAIMTFRLIAEHPELVSAAGIVAGAVGSGDDAIAPKGPVPLIMFHGRKDDIIDYGSDDPAHPGTVAQNVALWTKANGCPAKPSKTDRPVPTVQRDTYLSPTHAEVILYSLDNGNHMWPGGKVMPGKTLIPVQDISATDLMWDFFKAHAR